MTEPKDGDEAPEETEEPEATAAEDVDATGADAEERDAKEELFEAIDHLKSAASILFQRASKDPAVKTATKEAGRALRQFEDVAEPVVKQVSDAAEPIAKELTKEVGRLTRDVWSAVDSARQKVEERRARRRDEEEEEE